MKCVCKRPDCELQIVRSDRNVLSVEGTKCGVCAHPVYRSFYVDANALVELILDLKAMLMDLTEPK